MKVFGVAACLMLLSAPAMAQALPNINLMPDVKSMTEEEKEQDAANQRAYRESLRKIPTAKTDNDPWGGVRSEAPKPAAKAPRTKTGNATN